jgi:serine/arginine repetitive matrix protein 1
MGCIVIFEFFQQGTSTEQDNRFSDKEKKLLKTIKFAENVTKKVNH